MYLKIGKKLNMEPYFTLFYPPDPNYLCFAPAKTQDF